MIKFPFCTDLAPLENFDPKIFYSDNKSEQDICNFILCLSCVYNDFKDAITNLYMLDEMSSRFKKYSAEWGEIAGLNFHFIRLVISINHELIKLVENNISIIEQPFFKSIIVKLDSMGGECWNALVSVAKKQNPKDKRGKILSFIRNKVGSHYDLKEIFKGYQKCFLLDNPKPPYISKSNILRKERHYFSEAAMQGYFEKILSDQGIKFEEIRSLSHKIGPAMSQIVKLFIEERLKKTLTKHCT